METIGRLKRKVLKQQQQIDALTTLQIFMFGFLAELANVDLSLSARALTEMLQDSTIRDNKYLYVQLKKLEEVSMRVGGSAQECKDEFPSWFRGIINGGLSREEDDGEE